MIFSSALALVTKHREPHSTNNKKAMTLMALETMMLYHYCFKLITGTNIVRRPDKRKLGIVKLIICGKVDMKGTISITIAMLSLSAAIMKTRKHESMTTGTRE